ncbi:MAG: hypothetical protein ACYCZF_13835 [Anaerolineae bacterium]
MADSQKTLILWLAGGAGVVLLYSAYKNKNVVTTLADTLSNPSGVFAPGVAVQPSAATGNTSGITYNEPVPALPDAGKKYVFDKNGFMVQVPDAYQNNTAAFIPAPLNTWV